MTPQQTAVLRRAEYALTYITRGLLAVDMQRLWCQKLADYRRMLGTVSASQIAYASKARCSRPTPPHPTTTRPAHPPYKRMLPHPTHSHTPPRSLQIRSCWMGSLRRSGIDGNVRWCMSSSRRPLTHRAHRLCSPRPRLSCLPCVRCGRGPPLGIRQTHRALRSACTRPGMKGARHSWGASASTARR